MLGRVEKFGSVYCAVLPLEAEGFVRDYHYRWLADSPTNELWVDCAHSPSAECLVSLWNKTLKTAVEYINNHLWLVRLPKIASGWVKARGYYARDDGAVPFGTEDGAKGFAADWDDHVAGASPAINKPEGKMAKFSVGQVVSYVGKKKQFNGRWRVGSIDTSRDPIRYNCTALFQRADPTGILIETSLANDLGEGATKPSDSVKAEVFVLVDEDGNVFAGTDRDDVGENYAQDYDAGTSRHVYRIILDLPIPQTYELRGKISGTDEVGTVAVVSDREE
ncbi:hypothetical protein AYO40_01040 [Planctomycetaceae bacterium SCGC AG-212-D15]|nr:hypothetical protein AYO40_01040 [Planctomycetaceae bacterium SCGC AG-212-D15]